MDTITPFPLYKLPPELLLMVASFLPSESVVCLGLTCHSFHAFLEGAYLKGLYKDFKEAYDWYKGWWADDYKRWWVDARMQDLRSFLHLLERDLPGYLLCPHCDKFHDMAVAEQYLPSNIVLVEPPQPDMYDPDWEEDTGEPCVMCRTLLKIDGHEERICQGFSEMIFRMAMKAYRLGQDTSKFLALLSYHMKSPIDWSQKLDIAYINQERVSSIAKIHEGSMLIRQQRIFVMPSTQELPLPWTNHWHIFICDHIRFHSMSSMYKHGIDIPDSTTIKGWKNTQGVISCTACWMEFRIDFKSYGEDGNAMFVTRWLDLGEGSDPWNDKKWSSIDAMSTGDGWLEPPVGEEFYPRGSICEDFEGGKWEDFVFDAALSGEDEEALRKVEKREWPDRGVKVKELKGYYGVKDGRFVPMNVPGFDYTPGHRYNNNLMD
jgi:hypothetical protein